jgi:peptidyl-prolyl cis-trans isomerase D
MFDFVRKHTKVMMFLMFLLIIPAFVLVGVDGFKRINDGGATVAQVAGQNILQAEWDSAHKSDVDRIRARQPGMDVKLLDSPQARYVTLEKLVRERVMAQAVKALHMGTTDARLARELQQDPTIATLRKADGSLDMERYRQLAASQGLTPEGFEEQVRADLSLRQLENGIVGSALSTTALADVALHAFFERRDVQLGRFAASDYAAKVNPSIAEMEAFYQSNTALFKAPEAATVEYVILDLDTIKKSIALSDADVRTYYDQNVGRLSGKEERRASHILLNADKAMVAAERQKVKERAQSLLAQIRKSPDSFSELARKNSQDTGSAPKGGDLDYFGRGAMVKPFEDAVFAMQKGQVSELVETDFGYHIIKLTDIKAPKPKSFDELRAGIEADLKMQQAQRKFAEVAETFTNGVYEQSDSLKPVAEKLKLEIRSTGNLQRKPSPAQTGIFANPKLLAAIFSADSLENKRNTEAVEIKTNQLVSARVSAYTAERLLTFKEVQANVRERLIASQSAELAKKDGMEKLALWKAENKATSLMAPVIVSREQAQALPAPLLNAILLADTTTLPQWIGVDLGVAGYGVVRINKVFQRPAVDAQQSQQERAQYLQWYSGAEAQGYYHMLKERFKVRIDVARPDAQSTESSAIAQ